VILCNAWCVTTSSFTIAFHDSIITQILTKIPDLQFPNVLILYIPTQNYLHSVKFNSIPTSQHVVNTFATMQKSLSPNYSIYEILNNILYKHTTTFPDGMWIYKYYSTQPTLLFLFGCNSLSIPISAPTFKLTHTSSSRMNCRPKLKHLLSFPYRKANFSSCSPSS